MNLIAISQPTQLTKEQLEQGYCEGFNDVVYDKDARKEIGQSSWWASSETAGNVALERIRDIELKKVWNKYKT